MRGRLERADLSTDEIVRRYQTGESLSQVALALNTTHATVGRRLRKAGVATRKPESDPVTRFKRFYVESDGCWEWLGAKSTTGYGSVWDGRRRETASRVAWTIQYGAIPAGLCVCHHCDNRLCVRPDHLFLGTNADNTHDMIRKGRQVNIGPPPERAIGVKLTWDAVREIRGMAGSLSTVAALFGVAPSTIGRIRTGMAWRVDVRDAAPREAP